MGVTGVTEIKIHKVDKTILKTRIGTFDAMAHVEPGEERVVRHTFQETPR